MDKELVLAKLESLYRCIQRVESQHIISLEELQLSLDKQDIAVLNLERAVQLCVDIASHILADAGGPVPDTMAGTFQSLVTQGILDEALGEKLKKRIFSRLLLSGKTFFTIFKLRADTSHEVSAILVTFVFAQT